MQELPHEPHPFEFYIPDNARTLFIGTFPPPKHRWSVPFFYPNKTNLFWTILRTIVDPKGENLGIDSIETRKQILQTLGAGITDMGKIIQRKLNNALDENLVLVEPMPILSFLEQHPSIEKVLLMSSSGPVSALRWFIMHLAAHNIYPTVPKGKKPFSFPFEYQGKTYMAYVLYSPSRRAANRITLPELVAMYKSVLFEK